jgi:hypothetical protein
VTLILTFIKNILLHFLQVLPVTLKGNLNTSSDSSMLAHESKAQLQYFYTTDGD